MRFDPPPLTPRDETLIKPFTVYESPFYFYTGLAQATVSGDTSSAAAVTLNGYTFSTFSTFSTFRGVKTAAGENPLGRENLACAGAGGGGPEVHPLADNS